MAVFDLLHYFRTLCRSPIIPARPVHSSELLSQSLSSVAMKALSRPSTMGSSTSSLNLYNNPISESAPADLYRKVILQIMRTGYR